MCRRLPIILILGLALLLPTLPVQAENDASNLVTNVRDTWDALLHGILTWLGDDAMVTDTLPAPPPSDELDDPEEPEPGDEGPGICPWG